MTVEVHMFRDDRGLPRAKAKQPFEALGTFLEFDVQGRADASRDLLTLILDVQTQVVPHWEGTGNSSTLTLTPTRAHIYNEFAIPTLECELPLSDFQKVIEAWLEFVTSQCLVPPSQYLLN